MIETKSVTIARNEQVVSLRNSQATPPRPLKVNLRYRKFTLNDDQYRKLTLNEYPDLSERLWSFGCLRTTVAWRQNKNLL